MKGGERETHVKRIISEPLDIIESEHGLAGLDHVLDILQDRRNTMIFDLQRLRDKGD